jgi:transmembrane sensor
MTSKAPLHLINHEAIETTAAAWLARQDNAPAWTRKEERELQAWLDEHVAHRVAWLRLRQAWSRANVLRAADRTPNDVNASAGWHGIHLSNAGKRRGRFAASAVAAIVAAVVYLTHAPEQGVYEREQFVTAVGARQGVTLADGSRVMLNSRTRASVAISRNERKFWLDEGEAFFEIQHDASRPFVLMAGNDRITVLGTKFVVRRSGDLTRVTVVEGRVKFEPDAATRPAGSPDNASVLTPNHSAISNAGSVLVGEKTAQETERELSWRAGRLEFVDRPLADIAAEFNRYNRRQLVVDDTAAGLLLSGRFDMYNVDGFVRSVQTGFGVVARTEGEQIRLTMK